MPAAAIKAGPPADPLDAAEAEQEAAESDVKRLTLAINDLQGKGPGADPVLLVRLRNELEDAQKLLRRVDLEAAELTAAADGPLSPKVLEKIRVRRRKVEDWHSAVMGRMAEARSLREHVGRVKGEIAQLRASWEFRRDQQELRSSYVFPADLEDRDNPPPDRSAQKNSKSMAKLALLERALETAGAELRIAAAAQIAASARWETEKRTLDGWESAIRALGPSARAVLNAMPQPGADTLGPVTNQTDFRDAMPGYSLPTTQ